MFASYPTKENNKLPRAALKVRICACLVFGICILYVVFHNTASETYHGFLGEGEGRAFIYDPADFPTPLRPDIVDTPPHTANLPYRSLYDIVADWNPNDLDIPLHFEESLQHFDWSDPYEHSLAVKYRDAEIPFKLFNIPEFMHVSTLWTDNYLIENVGDRGSMEISPNNHYLFANRKHDPPKDYGEFPTSIKTNREFGGFAKWLSMAKEADVRKLPPDDTHVYFLISNPEFEQLPTRDDRTAATPNAQGAGPTGGGRGGRGMRGRGGPRGAGRTGGGGDDSLRGGGRGGRGSPRRLLAQEHRRLGAGGGPARGAGRGRGGRGAPNGAVSGHREISFVSRDLSLFSTMEPNFFKDSPSITNCRFGMRGIIAEAHFDSGRNFVGVFRGSKRYILARPEACSHMGIITDSQHPSYRQSLLDWADLEHAKSNHFEKIDAIETVMHAGEVLYIPSYWFHYIVSLDQSIQCNTRNGRPEDDSLGKTVVDECLGLGYGAK